MATPSDLAGGPEISDLPGLIVPGEMITFEFPSDKKSYGPLVRTLDALLGQTKLTERQAKDLKQAVVEMAGNAMEWGHGFNPALDIQIDFRLDPETVTFRVRDQGAGFEHFQNGRTMPSIDELWSQGRTELLKGFGIMLARGIVDEFFYNDRGNEVTLIKRLDEGIVLEL